MRRLLEWSFGCRHAHTSFPQTVPSRRGHPAVGARGGHHTVGAGSGLPNVAAPGGHPNVGAVGGLPNVGPGGDHSIVGAGRGHPNVGGHHNVGAPGAKVTYVTCLNCGQEFNYCWRTMQRLSSAPNWAPTWIDEQMTGNGSSRERREIEELRHLWMT